MTLLLAGIAAAGTPYLNGKIVKWDNGTYPDGNKSKTWIVYQLQTDTSVYSIARKKENKAQMQAGEAVQYQMKNDNKVEVVNARGKKNEYQVVGQSQVQ